MFLSRQLRSLHCDTKSIDFWLKDKTEYLFNDKGTQKLQDIPMSLYDLAQMVR